MTEVVYTAAELRMLNDRAKCESEGHVRYQIVAAAWPFGVNAQDSLILDSHTWECDRCDGVISVAYPKIGREA